MVRSSNRKCRGDIDNIIIKAVLETWILHKHYIGVIIGNDEHGSGSWQTLTVFGKVFLFELFRSGNQTLVGSSNWAQESWPLLLSRPTYEMTKILERVCNLSYDSGYVSAAFVTNQFSIFKIEFGAAKTLLRSTIFKLLWYCKHFEDYKFQVHFIFIILELRMNIGDC